MKLLFLFLTTFLLTACGAKKLAVNHADSLISNQITKRLPLYSQQKEELDKDLDKFLNDTKPIVQDILPVIDKIEIDKSKVAGAHAKLKDFYLKIADKFSALISKYMSKLDSKQQKEFFENLDDENRMMAKKDKEPILDDVKDKFEHFFGALTSAQKQILADYSDYFFQRNKERVLLRKKLHQEMKTIYENEISPDSKVKTFHELFMKYQNDMIKGNKHVEILEKIIPTLSKEQKEHFRKELQGVRELLSYYLSVDY